VLVDGESGNVRVYRRIGRDFWALAGDPRDPSRARFAFLEVLLGLTKGLSAQTQQEGMVAALNAKMKELARAIDRISFAAEDIPMWIVRAFTTEELSWFATTMTAFYDEGI